MEKTARPSHRYRYGPESGPCLYVVRPAPANVYFGIWLYSMESAQNIYVIGLELGGSNNQVYNKEHLSINLKIIQAG